MNHKSGNSRIRNFYGDMWSRKKYKRDRCGIQKSYGRFAACLSDLGSYTSWDCSPVVSTLLGRFQVKGETTELQHLALKLRGWS